MSEHTSNLEKPRKHRRWRKAIGLAATAGVVTVTNAGCDNNAENRAASPLEQIHSLDTETATLYTQTLVRETLGGTSGSSLEAVESARKIMASATSIDKTVRGTLNKLVSLRAGQVFLENV